MLTCARSSCLSLAAFLLLAPAASAVTITLEVSALIDGRDQLIIRADTLQWHHLDYAAVGRIDGRNEPTVLTTTLDGALVMDHVPWTPDWPLPPPDEIRFEAFSSVLTGLTPALPSQDMTVTLEVLEARSILHLVQLPTAGNDYTTVLEFNDNAPDGAADYRGRLTFEFAAVPEPTSAVLLCFGLVLGGVARQLRSGGRLTRRCT